MGDFVKILLVLHEASRTGAPRIGGLIASALQKQFEVTVVVLKDGPLREWLVKRVGAENVVIADRGPVHLNSFDVRVDFAKAILKQHDCDIVYVNSLASSEFLAAAKLVSRKSLLHVHEKIEEMQSLLRQQVTKYNITAFPEALILAGDGLAKDMVRMFGDIPDRILNWGIAVDTEEIVQLSNEDGAPATNISGKPLISRDRMRIGMVGHASPRKGSDIFLEVAKGLPERDFVWVGNWDEVEAPENINTHTELLNTPLENFYLTGSVSNPYRHIKQFDLFFLSSREDPNPVVLAEAMLLRVPILVFSRVTAVTDFLGRSALLYHGQTSNEAAKCIINGLDATKLRSGTLSAPIDIVRERFDLSRNIDSVVNLLLLL
jgi:glycosyltransferase involved in cell wall biosynthesis